MEAHFVAVIERDDGSTYEQPYVDHEDLKRIIDNGRHYYKVVDIYVIE